MDEVIKVIIPYDPSSDPDGEILNTPLSEIPAFLEYTDILWDWCRVCITLCLPETTLIEARYKGGPLFIKSSKSLLDYKQVSEPPCWEDDEPNTYYIEIHEDWDWVSYNAPFATLSVSNEERLFNIHPKAGYVNPSQKETFVRKSRTRAYFAGIADLYGIDANLYGKCYRLLIINDVDRVQQILGLKIKKGQDGDNTIFATVYDYTDKRYYDVPWSNMQFRLGLSDV